MDSIRSSGARARVAMTAAFRLRGPAGPLNGTSLAWKTVSAMCHRGFVRIQDVTLM